MSKIKELYQLYISSTGVCTDTRKINKGCLFFALKGANFNGNLFAETALKQGAYRAVVDDATVVHGDNYILVDDVLKSLQDVAVYHRQQLNIPVIGITGTNGKTTTKELAAAVLAKKYNVLATKGNLNNHIGVPLTLLSINSSIELAVIEMGANHPGEIDFLCQIAQPDFGLITNVGMAHLEGFGSFEGVKKTKAELYNYLQENKGLIFKNSGNKYLKDMLPKDSKLFNYGIDENDRIRVRNVGSNTVLSFEVFIDNEPLKIESNLIGSYNLENILAAISLGCYFGVNKEDVALAIKEYIPENNRSQLVSTEKNEVLFDAYNANPTSLNAALENLIGIDKKNKSVILGEMKELGDESCKEHKKVVDFLKKNLLHKVVLIGESYKKVLNGNEGFLWFKNVDECIERFNEVGLKDAFVLVKGSRSNQLEKLKQVL